MIEIIEQLNTTLKFEDETEIQTCTAGDCAKFGGKCYCEPSSIEWKFISESIDMKQMKKFVCEVIVEAVDQSPVVTQFSCNGNRCRNDFEPRPDIWCYGCHGSSDNYFAFERYEMFFGSITKLNDLKRPGDKFRILNVSLVREETLTTLDISNVQREILSIKENQENEIMKLKTRLALLEENKIYKSFGFDSEDLMEEFLCKQVK